MPYKYNPFTGELDRVGLDALPVEVPLQFDTDSGTAVSVANSINLFGTAAQGLSTSGAGDTVTFTVDDATISQKGVCELATDAEAIDGSLTTNFAINPSSLKAKLGTQTANAIPYGAGTTSAIQWTDALEDGEIVIGATGLAPAAGAITSLDGSIDVTLGPNTIDIAVSGTGIISQIDADSGSATPVGGVIDVHGGNQMNTSATGNTVTIDLNTDVTVDSLHTADSVDGITINGQTISTDGSATNINLILDPQGSGTVNIAYATEHAIAIYGASGALSEVGPLTNGQLVIGSTGVAPVAGSLTSTGGTIDISVGAGTINLETDASVATSYDTDSGSAVPALGVLSVLGGGTTTTSGSGSTVTITSSADNTWIDQGSSTTIASNTNYFATAAVTLTLPGAPSQGDTIIIDADTASAVEIQANTGQTIRLGSSASSVAGTATTTDQGDCITLTYRSTGTTWHARGVQGNWTLA